MYIPDYHFWTDAEEQRLHDLLAAGCSIKQAAERLGRAYSGVQQKLAQKPHLRPARAEVRQAWSAEQDRQILMLAFQGMPVREIATRVHRTTKSVHARLKRLRTGDASTTRRMGRQPKPAAPTFDEQARRQAVAKKIRAQAHERLDLFRTWEARNARLQERLYGGDDGGVRHD